MDAMNIADIRAFLRTTNPTHRSAYPFNYGGLHSIFMLLINLFIILSHSFCILYLLFSLSLFHKLIIPNLN